MSPAAKERVARVITETWRAANGPSAARTADAQQRALTYAREILEGVVEEEVKRRLAEPNGG